MKRKNDYVDEYLEKYRKQTGFDDLSYNEVYAVIYDMNKNFDLDITLKGMRDKKFMTQTDKYKLFQWLFNFMHKEKFIKYIYKQRDLESKEREYKNAMIHDYPYYDDVDIPDSDMKHVSDELLRDDDIY